LRTSARRSEALAPAQSEQVWRERITRAAVTPPLRCDAVLGDGAAPAGKR
jgi:hypothetical protein